MAKTLEVGIGDLRFEFFANAFVVLGPFKTAGAVSAGTF
jgi:hypothetical protein